MAKENALNAILWGLLLFLCVFAYVGIPYAYIKWLRSTQQRRVRARSCIVLTFDDGPGARLTPALLDLLAEYDARATFFVLGRNIRGREHLIQAVAACGHEIGIHSYDHLHAWKVLPTTAIADLRRGRRELDRVLPLPPVIPVRPPYGKVNLLTLLYLLCTRAPICTWTLDTRDTWPAAARNGYHIADAIHRSAGAITLTHDFDRTEPELEEYVLSTVRAILDYAEVAGLQCLTISEALNRKGPSGSIPPSSRPALAGDLQASA